MTDDLRRFCEFGGMAGPVSEIVNDDDTITVVVQIGNSDNKLSQQDWAGFIHHTRSLIERYAHRLHFSGGSDWDAHWQNACFVCELLDGTLDKVKQDLALLAASYSQDSIAVIVGQVEFIQAWKGGE